MPAKRLQQVIWTKAKIAMITKALWKIRALMNEKVPPLTRSLSRKALYPSLYRRGRTRRRSLRNEHICTTTVTRLRIQERNEVHIRHHMVCMDGHLLQDHLDRDPTTVALMTFEEDLHIFTIRCHPCLILDNLVEDTSILLIW
jgi:hypothetical protein